MSDHFLFDSTLSRFRDWLKRFTGPRKFKRFGVDFSSTLNVKLKVDGKEISAALVDISKGGIGIELGQGYDDIAAGQLVKVSLSNDQSNWEDAEVQIRYIMRPNETRLRASVGLQFVGGPPAIIKSIVRS